MAWLRVHGEPVPDPRLLTATIDLAALENGAVVTGCSNMFYSAPANPLMPGLARVMGYRLGDLGAATTATTVAVRLVCATGRGRRAGHCISLATRQAGRPSATTAGT